MRRKHAQFGFYCRTTRRMVYGNGGKSSHRAMHARKGTKCDAVATHLMTAADVAAWRGSRGD